MKQLNTEELKSTIGRAITDTIEELENYGLIDFDIPAQTMRCTLNVLDFAGFISISQDIQALQMLVELSNLIESYDNLHKSK